MLKDDLIFIHIPKTAGRSILQAMGEPFNPLHKSVREYCEEIGEKEIRKKFVFATIRNPWDRAVSWWAHFDVINGKQSFSEWAIKEPTRDFKNTFPKVPFSQLSFCCNQNGEIMVNTFLRFENLKEDFKSIADRLGISPQLQKIGYEDRKLRAPLFDDYHDAYTTQESIDAISLLESDAITRFGYIY